MQPSLPTEITDFIISLVEDKASLCNCALVCHGWLPASRHCLFQHIKIKSSHTYDLLVNRVLRSDELSEWLPSVLSVDLEDYRPDGRELPFIHEFAGRLPNMHRLSLKGTNWGRIHPSAPAVLSRFSSISELRLADCSFPSFASFRHALTSLPSLTSLTLHYPKWPVPSLNFPTTRLRIVDLDIRFRSSDSHMNALFLWFLSASLQCSVRTLKWISLHGFRPDLTGACLDFISFIAPSVLSLSGSSCCIPIIHFANLQHLTIDVWIYESWENAYENLEKLPKSTHLRSLCFGRVRARVLPPATAEPLRAPNENENDEDDETEPDLSHQLELLEPILEHDRFQDLREIKFTLISWPRSPSSLLSFCEGTNPVAAIREKLPKACSRGIELSARFDHCWSDDDYRYA